MKQKIVRSRKRIKRNRFSKKKGGQYLSNVGYSTGYSAPFFRPYVENIA